MKDQTELLIELVREQPMLYDTRHVHYKREDYKQKIREEICQKLNEALGFDDWSGLLLFYEQLQLW